MVLLLVKTTLIYTQFLVLEFPFGSGKYLVGEFCLPLFDGSIRCTYFKNILQ